MICIKKVITATGIFILLFSNGNVSASPDRLSGSYPDMKGLKTVQTQTKSAQKGAKSVQTKTKSAKTGSKTTPVKTKSVQKSPKPETVNKIKDPGTVTIGTQKWAVANLNVSTFRNGDTIPEARTNKEWVAAGDAGKPAWCYYNNEPAKGQKYGKLYNWYAVNDPRGLAPEGWTVASDADWSQLAYFLRGQVGPGFKLKSISGWADGSNGSDEIGFAGLAGGYRIENGSFLNMGGIGTWWSSTESKNLEAYDHFLSLSNSLGSSSTPKQRGESVRCIRK